MEEDIKAVPNWEFGNPFGEIQQVTHYKMCWKNHGLCATRRLEELLMILSLSKKKVDRDELIKILES